MNPVLANLIFRMFCLSEEDTWHDKAHIHWLDRIKKSHLGDINILDIWDSEHYP